MSCNEPVDLVAYVKGELANGERAEAEAHLSACPGCREEAQRLGALLGQVAALPGVEPDPGFTHRVMLAARARHPEIFRPAPAASRESWWAVLRRAIAPAPTWTISLAAHLALLFVLSYVFLHTPLPTREPAPIVVGIAGLRPGDPPRDLARVAPRPEDTAPEIESTPDRPPAVPQNPAVRFAPKPPGRIGVPALVRVEDRRILSFVERRADGRLRRQALAQHGGEGTEEAVDLALRWLADRQEPDGSWNPARFGGTAGDDRSGGTGLAALAFLGAGHTHTAGPYRETVSKALRRLAADQQKDGSLCAPGAPLLHHALATLALIEAYCQTDDETLKPAVAAAVGFTQFAQNESGGWGSAPRSGASDASVTGWQVMALELGRAKGFLTAASSLRQAMEWLDAAADAGGDVTTAQTAVGMFMHLAIAPVPDAARLERQASQLAGTAPAPPLRSGAELRDDLDNWYFTAQALFQLGGSAWDRWNAAMKPVLLGAQEKTGEHAGAWGPSDRLGSTSIAVLLLETYYRYPRLGVIRTR